MHIGLSSWIIQDGNYGEFETDREYRFALEFYPHEIAVPDASSEPRLIHLGDALHDAWGTVVFRSDSAWVVDFGVLAFQEAKPPDWANPGVFVSGRVYVGVDPFSYFERLKNEKGMPNLFRSWRVRRILLETTPWLHTVDSMDRKVTVRDTSRESFAEVSRTDAWNDDGGNGHYILECEQTQEPAV